MTLTNRLRAQHFENMNEKPMHVKPALYAYCYENMKATCAEYGYNLVLHGSMNRDLDLIAIPWENNTGDVKEMIDKLCELIGATLSLNTYKFPHNGTGYLINLNRGNYSNYFVDKEYYIELLVLNTEKK